MKAVYHVLVSSVDSMQRQLGVNLGSTWGQPAPPHRGVAVFGQLVLDLVGARLNRHAQQVGPYACPRSAQRKHWWDEPGGVSVNIIPPNGYIRSSRNVDLCQALAVCVHVCVCVCAPVHYDGV